MTDKPAKRVLLVEDEDTVRLIGADMLSDAGYQVIEAATADEALRVLQEVDEVDVLFTDVRMPGSMDGLELAALVHDNWPKVKILVTSGDHRPGSEDLPDNGRFLPKPYSLRTMCKQVDDLAAQSPF